jgi:Zn-finger nucleic acid-binding protein
MRDTEFARLDPVADLVNDKCEELYQKGAFNEILARLKQVVAELPGDYSVSFDIQMNVFDNNRERSLRLLDTGFNVLKGEEPYRHYGDSTAQKYLVDGEICVVPDDYCPHCWGDWVFKFQHPACPHCGYELGRQVKYLLDTDKCPHCQEGTMTVDRPVCDKCGFEVDGKRVAWG